MRQSAWQLRQLKLLGELGFPRFSKRRALGFAGVGRQACFLLLARLLYSGEGLCSEGCMSAGEALRLPQPSAARPVFGEIGESHFEASSVGRFDNRDATMVNEPLRRL
jgi:hypothetical protein